MDNNRKLPKNLDTFGKRLKFLREQKKKIDPKWTQGYIAKQVGVARVTYTAYELDTKEPSRDTISKIADLLSTTTDFLLGRSVDPNMYVLPSGQYAIAVDEADRIIDHSKYEGISEEEFNRLKSFSIILNRGLKEKGISIENAAKAVHETPEYLESLIREPKKIPDASMLKKLADLISVTPDYLGGYTNDPQGTSPDTPKITGDPSDPEIDVFFKDYLSAPKEKQEELRRFWDFINQQEKNRKPGDKQGS